MAFKKSKDKKAKKGKKTAEKKEEQPKTLTFKPVEPKPVEKKEPPKFIPLETTDEKKEELKMPETLKEDLDKKPAKKGEKEATDELKMKMSYPVSSGGENWKERFEGILNDILSRLERIENSHNALSDELNEVRENINELETNMHELTALYDAISAQYNPFIDLTPRDRKIIGEETVDESGEEIGMENASEEEFEIAELGEESGEELPPAENLDGLELAEPITEQKPVKVEKGYILPEIPDNSMSHMMAIKWTEFMLEKVGPRNIRKLLEYYRSLRWISDRVMNSVLHQVQGFNTEAIDAEYDTWKMNTDDHMKTLVFIEKIKGSDVGTIHAEEVQDMAEDIKQG